MRVFGFVILAIGVVVMIIALAMDTSVASGAGRTHNIGLISNKEVTGIVGGALFVGGAVLYAAGELRDVLRVQMINLQDTVRKSLGSR